MALPERPKYTDIDRLNALNLLMRKYGKGWILRDSSFGKGLRLHESGFNDAVPDVRDAIDKFLHDINWKP